MTLEDGNYYLGALFFSLVIIMFNGFAEMSLTILRLPVFFKQRDLLFYPAWTYTLPTFVLRIPQSVVESGLWVVLTYFVIGFAPEPGRYNAKRSFNPIKSCYRIQNSELIIFNDNNVSILGSFDSTYYSF